MLVVWVATGRDTPLGREINNKDGQHQDYSMSSFNLSPDLHSIYLALNEWKEKSE